MTNKVGIGIIGTGFARKVQIPAFKLCKDALVASVSSASIDNAQSAADEFGIGHLSDDWKQTVLHPEVDLVCITTPPNLHKEMALFAIAEGKHVLCEKPMAMNAAEAREMSAAAAGKPLLALIDHELRFQNGRQLAYKMLRDGVIGNIRHVKAFFQAPHRGDPNIAWNWWSDKTVGGGALGAITSHIVDSFNWLLGSRVSGIFCQLQTHIKQRPDKGGVLRVVTSDDEANMLLRFHDNDLTVDATGLVSVSMTEYPSYRNSLELYGESGSMRIDHRGEIFIALAGEPDWRQIDVDMGQTIHGLPDTGFARGFVEFAPRIVEAIKQGATSIEHAATFEDGVEVQRVLDAARRSNETGTFVDLAS